MKKSELRQIIKEELLNEAIVRIPASSEDGDELSINVFPGNTGFMVGSKVGGQVDRVFIEWDQLKKIIKLRK